MTDAVLFRFGILLCFVISGLASTGHQRFEAIDQFTQDHYTTLWNELHQSWIQINEDIELCNNKSQITTYPICFGDSVIREVSLDDNRLANQLCPRALCLDHAPSDKDCFFTPLDTFDYLPPAAVTSLDNYTICAAPADLASGDPFISAVTYGMDLGIPPSYQPIVPVRLSITGTVSAFSQADSCTPIANAQVTAWQVNPTALTPFTTDGQFRHALDSAAAQRATTLGTPFSKTTTGGLVTDTPRTDLAEPFNHSLRSVSCRATQHTADDGSYTFETLMPPSYGPPRHIVFQVSAPGYETLTTRMYFDRDWRLQQLTTLGGDVNSRPTGPYSLPLRLGLKSNANYWAERFPSSAVSRDPRVAHLTFRSTATTSQAGMVAGVLEAQFNMVLRPLRSSLVEPTTATAGDGSTRSFSPLAAARDTSGAPPVDLNGLWADAQGAVVRVETHGPSFIAHEYPHPRTWGTALGTLLGNSIRGVDFRQVISAQTADDATKLRNNPRVDYGPSSTIWMDAGTSVGTVVPADPFSSADYTPTNPSAVSIRWAGGGYNNLWSKQPDNALTLPGYRYLKLLVSRESGGVTGGSLILNEIEFFQGVLAQDERPLRGFKMSTPRYPSPQSVACSSFLTQDTHCFKAFDGDSSSNSAWVTNPVGSRRHTLSTPQWVTFDFGEGRAVAPTAMRIVCDAKNAAQTARGCPMTFQLLGSQDNVKFDPLFSEDLYDYNRDYGPGGKTFYFVYDTVRGRANGQRCGSCTSGPAFTCSLQAYDGTCHSRYCGPSGLCEPEPTCPPGEYMHYGFQGYSRPSFFCKQCAAGRYGAESGLTSPACSGLCAEGHYCPAGSTSPTQFPCGGAHHYCPEGSPRPVPAAAGRYTVSRETFNMNHSLENSPPLPEGDVLVRVAQELCPRGSYCKGGVVLPCPAGRYGNITGLQTADCSAMCGSGTYCPEGTVQPLPCPAGYFCPNGLVPVICPAGTFGATTGLMSRQCSGYCAEGHYCPAGSTSAMSVRCPAGSYGDVAGLTNSSCSGLCAAGFYCPEGSVSKKQVPCGDSSLYCPEGSPVPTKVSKGYYSVGGTSPYTRTAQVQAEAGFYATRGVKWPCKAGTYGAEPGLNADIDSFYTRAPTLVPTASPTQRPTLNPTASPSINPTTKPTAKPSTFVTFVPTAKPTSSAPTAVPTTSAPTIKPTAKPSLPPTLAPTASPSTARPSTIAPTAPIPTAPPSTSSPSLRPSPAPSAIPTRTPSCKPTPAPSFNPALSRPPSRAPTVHFPTSMPSLGLEQTRAPTSAPSNFDEMPEMAFFCSGQCSPGHYCPRNTTVQLPCPAGRYGATYGLTNALCTAICPLGHYCVTGSSAPVKCPAGVYGNTTGLKDASCSTDCWEGGCNPTGSLCAAGYFCPEGSVSETQVQCGSADVYCPRGSAAPVRVSEGHYSVGSGSTLIRNTVDSSDRADTDDTEAHHTRVAQAICEEGHYCLGGIKRNCPPGTYGAKKGLISAQCSGLCAPGHYCPEGSINATTHRCPPGRYGSTAGLMDSSCSGLCSPGYHCGEASTSPTQLECAVLLRTGLLDATVGVRAKNLTVQGAPQPADTVSLLTSVYLGDFNITSKTLPNTNITVVEVSEPNSVYCPAGTAIPLSVRPGYYTVGNNRTTRFAQEPCPMGSYCVNGVVFDCPAGRYGRAERLMSPECTGLCAKGHYCPSGSVTSTQFPCPIGRYGSEEGLGSPTCSGPCVHPLDCPIGSVLARPRSEL